MHFKASFGTYLGLSIFYHERTVTRHTMVTSVCDHHLTNINVGHMVLRVLVAIHTKVGYVIVTKSLKLRKNACDYHVIIKNGLYLSRDQHFDCNDLLTINLSPKIINPLFLTTM